MGRTPDELVREIERERSHLGDDLSELEQRVKREVGSRGRVILVVLGSIMLGTLLAGFLIGRALRS